MDKKKLIKEHTVNKIDCNKIKTLTHKIKYTKKDNYVLSLELNGKKAIVKYKYPTSEVHVDKIMLDKLLLDIRTYICYSTKCILHKSRTHQRMTNYNMNKIEKLTNKNYVQIIQLIAENIIKLLTTSTEDETKPSIKKHFSFKNITSKFSRNKNQQTSYLKNCAYCNNQKMNGIKHTHFIKSNSTTYEQKPIPSKIKYNAIEEIFDTIDNIANENNIKILQTPAITTLGNKTISNNIRMTYGDINYLGSNKAIFYFDRGYKGKQMFTNSIESLERQPKHKDIVVIDEIVFTSNCQCNSSNQHKEMFPHYRVTCAVGLTCPARLNKHEQIIYARNKNATTQTFTTARSMLIRHW